MSYIYEKKRPTELYDDLRKVGRDNFSYEGAQALMEYLEALAEDQGEPIEYDPIAFCCDFSEYSEAGYEDLAEEYDAAPKRADFESDDDFNEALLEWLRDQTQVIEFDGGVILGSF